MDKLRYNQLLKSKKQDLIKLKDAEFFAYQIICGALIDMTIQGHRYATIYMNVHSHQMAYDILNSHDQLRRLKINTIVIQYNKTYHVKFQLTDMNKKPSSKDTNDIIRHRDDLIALQLDDKDELMCFLTMLLYDDKYIAIYDNDNQSYLYEHFKNSYRKGVYDTLSHLK